MATQQQVHDFHRFALTRLAQGGSTLTIDELYDDWRVQTATREDIAAVQAAILDMEEGDRGVLLKDHLREIRQKHDLPSEQ